MLFAIDIPDNFSKEIILRGCGYSVAKSLACLTLECGCKVGIALVGNNGQLVNFMNIFAEQFLVLANAVLVNTDTQATAYLLTLGRGTVAVAKRTYLEHIRVIPALP